VELPLKIFEEYKDIQNKNKEIENLHEKKRLRFRGFTSTS
jgi:hypothetical protein